MEYGTMADMEKLPSPRLLLTHLPFEFLPKRILEKRNKIVRISRNPKDLVVSYHKHMRNTANADSPILEKTGTFAEFFDSFVDGSCGYGSYFEFERRYVAELSGDDRVDHVFHTCFEKLKRDSLESIVALGKFLGVERSKEFYEEVEEKTSFDYVKAKRDAQSKTEEGRSLYRKGQVGDWINHLTVDQSRRIDKIVKEYE